MTVTMIGYNDLRRYLKDPLYKNSLFIILNSVMGTGFGFIFWMIAAKLYLPPDIGIATALISSQSLLVMLARFGFDSSIIRFFPEMDKSKIFRTSLTITSITTIILGIIYLIAVDTFSPQLHFLKTMSHATLFIIFLVATSGASLTGLSFVALRKSELYFVQNILVGSRVIFIFPLVFLGTIGIFGAVGLSFILAFLVSLLSLIKYGIRPGFEIDRKFLREVYRFSAGNYLSGLLSTAPNQILPLMILSVLGATETAHYYIAATLASPLLMIPASISMSLFVEGSHGESLKKNTTKSLILTFSLLIPFIIIFYFFGGSLLGLIGKSYVEGLDMLRALVFSSMFYTIYQIYYSNKMVQKDIKGLIFLSSLNFILLIGLSYILMHKFGILGVGYAWILGYGICSLVILGWVKRPDWVRTDH